MKPKILIQEQIDDGKQYPDQSNSTIIVKHHTTLKEFFVILKQKILYLILMSAMISIGASLSFIQDWRSKAALGTATLRVVPATGSLSSSKLYQIWLTVDKPVAFAHVEVMFNPDLIKLSQNLTLTNSVLNRVVVQTSIAEANMAGKFVIAIGLDPQQKTNAPTGSFKLADFYLTPNAALQGQIATVAFGGSSGVTDLDAGIMTIIPLDATVTLILDPTPTPTPIVTQPVVSPTNTPSIRPTNTPTVRLTPTPRGQRSTPKPKPTKKL